MKRLTELKQRLVLAWSILRDRDGNLEAHTQREMQAAGYYDGDEMNALMAQGVLDMIRVFSTQGHSGFSAPFGIRLFHEVASFRPLCPLTGADSEWTDVAEMSGKTIWQNKRCGSVFKDGDGRAYDIDAVVFEEPSGARFTGCHSRQFIAFPYTPRSVTAYVSDDATDLDKQLAAEVAWGHP